MAAKSEESKITVPYIPFKTFTGFVEKLHNSAVPSMIDNSVLQHMSGSMRTQLMSALKSLKLIQPNGTVSKELRALANAYNTGEWATLLGTVVQSAYVHVVCDTDLASGTSQQIQKAFKENGNVDGQVLDKAVRFYLAAMKEAGLPYSPHFDARKARKAGSRKGQKQTDKKGKPAANAGDDNDDDDDDVTDTTAKRLKFRLPIRGKADAVIALPGDVSADDWRILKIQLDAFIAPETAKGGSHD